MFYASANNSRRRASCVGVVRPAVRASVVLRPVRCLLSSVISRHSRSPFNVEQFQWNLPAIFITSAGVAKKCFKLIVQWSISAAPCVTVVGLTCASGYCAMWMRSPCYRCQTEVAPTRICPPTTRNDRRSNNIHQCAAPNCVGHRYDHMAGHVGRRPHYVRGTYIHRAVSIWSHDSYTSTYLVLGTRWLLVLQCLILELELVLNTLWFCSKPRTEAETRTNINWVMLTYVFDSEYCRLSNNNNNNNSTLCRLSAASEACIRLLERYGPRFTKWRAGRFSFYLVLIFSFFRAKDPPASDCRCCIV